MAYYGGGNSKQKNRQRDLFDTWSIWKKIQFWSVLAIILISIILFSIPMGMALLFGLFILPVVWKDPDDDSNPSNGMMIRGTLAYKVASFMSVLKNKHRKHIYSPIVMLGFGPPERDIHKGLHPSYFKPPTRVSAYWAITLAIPLSFSEQIIQYIRFPVWDFNSELPTMLMQILSGIGYFMAFQILWTARRFQSAIPLQGVEYTPAVMWNKLPKGEHAYARIFIKSLIVGSIISVVIAFVLTLASSQISIDKKYIYVGSAMFGASCALYISLRELSKKYREEFYYQCERREKWNSTWEYKNALTPFFEMETPVPGEVGKPGGPPEGEPVGEAHVWAATFSYPTNGTIDDYRDESKKIIPSIQGARMLTIAPLELKDNSNKPIRGSVSRTAFRVWWTDEDITLTDILENRDNFTPEQIEIAVRYNILEPLSNIKGIGSCLIHSHTMMTAPDSKFHIMRVNIIPKDGVVLGDFMKNISSISSALGAQWVRAASGRDKDTGRTYIELYVGNGAPNKIGVKFPEKAASRYRMKLFSVDWSYTFYMNKIMSSAGTPGLILSRPVTDVSNQLVYDVPAGIDRNIILKNKESLATTSGNEFIEVTNGVPDSKNLTRREKRELDKFIDANGSTSQFTMVAAVTHPLKRVFFFDNYKSKVITGREPGIAKTEFATGIKADGEIAKFSFTGDFPHVVLAGSSGSGKSALIYSMIVQLCMNNDPSDLQIWIVDPKVGYQEFQFVDNVTRYVDSWTPKSGVFFESVRDLMKDAVLEMQRRNEKFRFSDAGISIDKLQTARKIGLEQGPLPDGSPNPLMEPYIVIVLDEVAMLFAGAPDPETKDIQAEILYYASKLARESRSAGIHCLFATQYPTKASLPTLIKQQSGRIGLMAQDVMASKVIIDEPGLEKLFIKGTGKVIEGQGYRDFRGLLFARPEDFSDNMMDYLDQIPKREPDPEIDGKAARKLLGQDEESGNEYYDIPDIEDEANIFDQWDDSSSGKAYRTVIGDGKADNVFNKAIEEFASMPEEEFSQLTLEDFKKALEEARN